MSNSLRPHKSQHTRPPCPSPTPRVYSNSCPSSRWSHPAISHPLSSPSLPAPQILPESGSFSMSQLFTWGGQSIGVSPSASVLPMNTQDWCPSAWTGWSSLSLNHESVNIIYIKCCCYTLPFLLLNAINYHSFSLLIYFSIIMSSARFDGPIHPALLLYSLPQHHSLTFCFLISFLSLIRGFRSPIF